MINIGAKLPSSAIHRLSSDGTEILNQNDTTLRRTRRVSLNRRNKTVGLCTFQDCNRFLHLSNGVISCYEIFTSPKLQHKLLFKQEIDSLIGRSTTCKVAGPIALACEDTVVLITLQNGEVYYGNIKPALNNLQRLQFGENNERLSECLSMDSCRTRPMVLAALYSGELLNIHFNQDPTTPKSVRFVERIRVSGKGLCSVSVVSDGSFAAVCSNWDVTLLIRLAHHPEEMSICVRQFTADFWVWTSLMNQSGSKMLRGLGERGNFLDISNISCFTRNIGQIPLPSRSEHELPNNTSFHCFQTDIHPHPVPVPHDWLRDSHRTVECNQGDSCLTMIATTLNLEYTVTASEESRIQIWQNDTINLNSRGLLCNHQFDREAEIANVGITDNGICIVAFANGNSAIVDALYPFRSKLLAFAAGKILPIDILRMIRFMLYP